MLNFFSNNIDCTGAYYIQMKLKEYRLIIMFDPDTGEVKQLEESCSTHYKFEINADCIKARDGLFNAS